MKKISIVIPCYKSQDMISDVVDGIVSTFHEHYPQDALEIILVNDSSPDSTYLVIKEICKRLPFVTGIDLAKNFGQHSAIMAGLRKTTGDIILCMDDDGQTPPREIPKLIGALNENTDVVYAQYEEKKHSIFRNFGSKVNDAMCVLLLKKPKTLFLSSFFAMKRYVRDEIVNYDHSYPYLAGLILRTTNRIANINVSHQNRATGDSGYTIKKLLRLWVNGFTNFSVIPLRLSMGLSILFFIVGLILAIVLTINRIMNPEVPMGWTSIIVLLLISSSMIMFVLGLIGEYIGRIYISINNMPQYVIRKDTISDNNQEGQAK